MLLKVGVAMMAFAIAFTAVTTAIVVVLRNEPEPAIAAKPASKPATEPSLETLRASKPAAEPSAEPLIRSYSLPKPRVERAESRPESEPKPEPKPKPNPQPQANPKSDQKPELEPEPERTILPVAKDDWPMPTDEELQVVDGARYYDLSPGAIMGLTIEAMGLYNVPVFNSDSESALAQGIIHEPETSLPWSNTPQRNVFLAGHRLGYRDSWSRLVFYNLNQLGEGDIVVLKDREGRAYRYRVSEVFVVDPTDVWVMGQVRGRDMVTLQTCTPIPTFEKRLIVRADRV